MYFIQHLSLINNLHRPSLSASRCLLWPRSRRRRSVLSAYLINMSSVGTLVGRVPSSQPLAPSPVQHGRGMLDMAPALGSAPVFCGFHGNRKPPLGGNPRSAFVSASQATTSSRHPPPAGCCTSRGRRATTTRAAWSSTASIRRTRSSCLRP